MSGEPPAPELIARGTPAFRRASLGIAFSDSFTTLLWLRALLGIALGVLPATAIAYLGDSMQRGALISAVGLYIGGNTVGGAGGRLLGGFIADHVSLDAVFLIIGASSLLCTLVVLVLLPPRSEERRVGKERSTRWWQ